MRHLITFLATGCYIGKFPFAPGTAGTVMGVLLYLLIKPLPPVLYVVTVVAFIFMAAWVSTKAQDIMGEQDPQEVVIDEVAGFLVTMAFHRPDIWMLLGGFVIFRVFDIVKPFPIRWIERHFLSGWGIVLDDVAAGVYANVALWLVGLALPRG